MSNDITSASVLLCDTAVSFFHARHSHMLCSILVTARADALTVRKMSGRPIRAKYMHPKIL